MNADKNALFDWQRYPDSADLVANWVHKIVDANPLAASLRQRMLDETGTRLIDWVDHLCLPDADEELLVNAGFQLGETGSEQVWRHGGGMFPRVRVGAFDQLGMSIRVDSIEDFVRVHAVDANIAGFFALRKNRDFAELDHLWVDPPFIGKGLGRLLLDRAVEVCRGEGIERIEIDSDPYAEPFYLRMGARRIGKTAAPVEGDPERYLPRLMLDVGLADAD